MKEVLKEVFAHKSAKIFLTTLLSILILAFLALLLGAYLACYPHSHSEIGETALFINPLETNFTA